MLVLKRRRGQSIRIGTSGEVTIKFLSYEDGAIRVCIDAPKSVSIDREEIHFQKLSHAHNN